jgi:SAM-dependent methyltransferase
MHIKYVFSFAIERSDGRVLFVRRHLNDREYAGAWSLPSKRVSPEQYLDEGSLGSAAHDVLREMFDGDIDAPEPLARATRDRREYRIHMTLFYVKLTGALTLTTKKYRESCWSSDDVILDLFPDGGGLCVMMLVRHMIEMGRLSPASNFVEMPPELYGGETAFWDNRDIWNEGAFDEYVAAHGESGVAGGFLVKAETADRYVRRRLDEVLHEPETRFLDIGCGTGAIVSELRTKGVRAWGCDLGISRSAPPEGFFWADVEAGEGLSLKGMNVLLLNLVLPWIADAGAVLRNVRKLCVDDALVIVTLVPPDFAKNGSMVCDGGEWVKIIDKPFRRKPFLTMINHNVGPLLYYPRLVTDYLNAFYDSGFVVSYSEYLFLDSEVNDEELRRTLSEWPGLSRHLKFPSFLVFELRARRDAGVG